MISLKFTDEQVTMLRIALQTHEESLKEKEKDSLAARKMRPLYEGLREEIKRVQWIEKLARFDAKHEVA